MNDVIIHGINAIKVISLTHIWLEFFKPLFAIVMCFGFTLATYQIIMRKQ